MKPFSKETLWELGPDLYTDLKFRKIPLSPQQLGTLTSMSIKWFFLCESEDFKKKKVLEFSTHFFSYSVFSSHEKMVVGRGGAQKGRKKTFILLPCLKQMSKHMSDSSLAIFSIIRRIKIQNWIYFPLIQDKW